MAYTKLFSSIVTSTIWSEDDKTRIVWITMLALADKNGEVQASVPGLAKVAGVPIEAVEVALKRFKSPDPYSRTKDDEGRRIEEVPGGWILLNYRKYREMASREEAKAANAERQRRFRERAKRNGFLVTRDENNGVCNGGVTDTLHIAEAEAEAEAESTPRAFSEPENQNQKPARLSSETYDVLSPPVSPEEGGRAGDSVSGEGVEGKKNPSPVAQDALETSGRVETAGKGSDASTAKSEGKNGLMSETSFLALAEKIGVPADHASIVFAELEAKGWVGNDGNRISSPGAFLASTWKRNGSKDHGREPWMIEQDIARVKAEIAKVLASPDSKTKPKTFEDHKREFEGEWMKVVRACYNETRDKLPDEFASFEIHLEAERERARSLRTPENILQDEAFTLNTFVEFMPRDDVPDFARWDSEWNKRKSWKRASGIAPKAKDETATLKAKLAELENELRKSLVTK